MATPINNIILVAGITTITCGGIFVICRYITNRCPVRNVIIHPFPYERSGTASITRSTIMVEGVPSEFPSSAAIIVLPHQDNLVYREVITNAYKLETEDEDALQHYPVAIQV